MKKTAYISGIILAFCAAGLSSCSSDEGQEAASAEQIEEAHVAGREAARVFVNKTWRDTLEMQNELVAAGAKGAAFDSIPRCREVYDSAFIATVRTVRPDVAAELERYRKQIKK